MYIKLIGEEINIRMPKITIKDMLKAGKREEDFQRLRSNSVSMKNASSFDITTKTKGWLFYYKDMFGSRFISWHVALILIL